MTTARERIEQERSVREAADIAAYNVWYAAKEAARLQSLLADLTLLGLGGSVEVVDNLLSVSATATLSANQGRILKALIDAKANAPKNAKILLNFNGVNNSNLFLDESPNNFTAGVSAFSNAKLSTAVKKFGSSSLALSSNSDYITISPNIANFSGNDFCIEAWIYPITKTNYGNIMGHMTAFSSAPYPGFALQWDFGTSKISLKAGFNGSTLAIDVLSSVAIASNAWTHIAVTRQGQVLRVFINGVKDIEVNSASTLFAESTTGGFGIGAASGSNRFGVGYIDGFRITEGNAVYTANFTPPASEF